jgi:[methyl-Co(III) methanol-specific corrinoid protein]:coenzyme M methyltransferase
MESERLNSRERVLGLFAGQEIDRIPVFSGMGNVTVHGLEQHGWRFPEIHLDGYKMAMAAASTPRLFGFECAVVPFDMGVEAEVLGCEVNYYAHHTDILYPTISGKLASKVEDLEVRVPEDLESAGRMPVVAEAIQLLKEDLGDQVAVGAWVLGPFTLAGQIVDLDDLLKMSFKKPDLVNGVLDTLDELLIALASIYKKAGADYLTVREMGATTDVLSPRIFGSLIRPHLERVFAGIESPKILHICGDTNTIVDQMAQCGADAISVDQKNELAASREKIGPDVILLGNLDPYGVLVMGKPEEVERSVKEIIGSGADAIWPGCDIWPTVPAENMERLMATARKYGARR